MHPIGWMDGWIDRWGMLENIWFGLVMSVVDFQLNEFGKKISIFFLCFIIINDKIYGHRLENSFEAVNLSDMLSLNVFEGR